MSFRFSTPRLLGILALAILTSCSGLETKDHPPLVFALNLSSETKDLSLVKDGVLVSFRSLGPKESRPLTKLDPIDGAVLQMGNPGAPASAWTDPSGTAYSLRFQTGHIYAIVVDPQGLAALYSLPETYSSDPKLCIVNTTSTNLSQVQVAPDWAKNVKVYAQDVVPVVPSEFYSFDPKTLGLYWQSTDQVVAGGHTVAGGPDGKPLRQPFLSGRYYLFLAGDGSIRDLTPNTD